MAVCRLVLYSISAMCNFSVSLSLWRLRPWLAKLFAFSLFSVVVTSVLYSLLLMEKLGFFEFSPLTSEIMFLTNALISAASALVLCVMFFRKNGEAGCGL